MASVEVRSVRKSSALRAPGPAKLQATRSMPLDYRHSAKPTTLHIYVEVKGERKSTSDSLREMESGVVRSVDAVMAP